MKKTMIVLSALLALVACNKENVQPESTSTVFNITINHENGTKAVKSGWENGDVVYVFFSTVAAPNYVKYTYDGTAWSNTKVGTFDITTNGTMTAIYLPYGNDAVVSADGTSFKFDKTFTSYFLKAEKAAYTVSGTTVSGTLNMEAPEGFVQFAMPLSGEVNSTATTFFRTTNPSNSQAITYTLSESNIKPVSFTSVSADGTVSQDETAAAGAPITGYIYGGDINFSGVLSSTVNGNATDYAFTFVNDNGTAETYDDVTYLLSGSKTLSYKAAIKFPAISSSAWKVPEPSYVEINGVKWATCNIGATTPCGYGDYFAWGAIYPQAKYENEDYRWSSLDANLAAANDVASQKLGSNWHMPSGTEIQSIFLYSDPGEGGDTITRTWGTKDGVNGYYVYETVNADDESKKVFFPAAGGWNHFSNEGFSYSGEMGFVRSSHWDQALTECCFSAWFNNTGDFKCGYYRPRNSGYSVRPVHD